MEILGRCSYLCIHQEKTQNQNSCMPSPAHTAPELAPGLGSTASTDLEMRTEMFNL